MKKLILTSVFALSIVAAFLAASPLPQGAKTAAEDPDRTIPEMLRYAIEDEYLAREERYDKQMKEKIGIDPEGKSTAEKVAITRKYREEQYEKLLDAVYKRRGWTENGVPKEDTIRRLGIDFPEVLELVKKNGG